MKKNTLQSNTYYTFPSLALVGELFTVIVDPCGSSKKSSEKTKHGAEAAGNRPNLKGEESLVKIPTICNGNAHCHLE